MAFLSGNGELSLRPVQREDLRQLAEWRNAADLRVRTREFRPLTEADQERWFSRITGPNRRDFMFVIDVAVDGSDAQDRSPRQANTREAVGVVGLCHWDPRDQTAEVSFYVGNEQARGKGYAHRALTLLHDYGFEELGLARIWAEVYAFNEPSIRILERLGYQREGLLRQHVWRGGRRVDSIVMGLLRDEWHAVRTTGS